MGLFDMPEKDLAALCRHQGIRWLSLFGSTLAIIGMRNRVVHAYFSIDKDIIWQTLKTELPALLTTLQTVLDRN